MKIRLGRRPGSKPKSKKKAKYKNIYCPGCGHLVGKERELETGWKRVDYECPQCTRRFYLILESPTRREEWEIEKLFED